MKAVRLPPISVFNRQRKIAVDRAGPGGLRPTRLAPVRAERGSGLTTLEEVDVLLISDRQIERTAPAFHANSRGRPTSSLFSTARSSSVARRRSGRPKPLRPRSTTSSVFTCVHGLLHLHGFDDRKPRGRARMKAVQEYIVAALGSTAYLSRQQARVADVPDRPDPVVLAEKCQIAVDLSRLDQSPPR